MSAEQMKESCRLRKTDKFLLASFIMLLLFGVSWLLFYLTQSPTLQTASGILLTVNLFLQIAVFFVLIYCFIKNKSTKARMLYCLYLILLSACYGLLLKLLLTPSC